MNCSGGQIEEGKGGQENSSLSSVCRGKGRKTVASSSHIDAFAGVASFPAFLHPGYRSYFRFLLFRAETGASVPLVYMLAITPRKSGSAGVCLSSKRTKRKQKDKKGKLSPVGCPWFDPLRCCIGISVPISRKHRSPPPDEYVTSFRYKFARLVEQLFFKCLPFLPFANKPSFLFLPKRKEATPATHHALRKLPCSKC